MTREETGSLAVSRQVSDVIVHRPSGRQRATSTFDVPREDAETPSPIIHPGHQRATTTFGVPREDAVTVSPSARPGRQGLTFDVRLEALFRHHPA